MKKKYKDYVALYNSKPCVLLRKILEKIENDCSSADIRDNDEHNNVIIYFNEENLHKKYTEKEFNQKLKVDACDHQNTKIMKLDTSLYLDKYKKIKLLKCRDCGHEFYKMPDD